MEVWNNRLLVAEGDWRDVGKAANSVRKHLITKLVEGEAVPNERSLQYWGSIPRSGFSASLFYLQQSPVWLYRGIVNIGHIRANWDSPVEFWQREFPKLDVFRPKDNSPPPSLSAKSTSRQSNKSTNLFYLPYELVHSSLSYAKHKLIGISAFVVVQFRNIRYRYLSLASHISEQKVSQLSIVQKSSAESIGSLLIAAEGVDLNNEEDVKNMIANIASAVLRSSVSPPETPQDGLKTLQKLLEVPTLYENQGNENIRKSTGANAATAAGTSGESWLSSVCAVNTFPTFTLRWWPLFVIVALGGWKLSGSWSDLVAWVDNSVISTIELFWNNWIVDPLLQIYRTIRHDESSQVALVAKESLTSDIGSLERMVVDFARDTDPGLTPQQLSDIGLAASRGNVTPVMSAYEKQISSPISSAITGKLIRTLLIQVQKSKVDLEVALSGIDQLLQSQQLVFGLIAAFPAILTIFWLLKLSTSGIWSSAMQKGQVRQSVIADVLLSLDKTIQSTPEKLGEADIGLIYTCVYLIKSEFAGHNSNAQERLLEQLDWLQHDAIVTRDPKIVLCDLDRAYQRYYLA